MIQRKISIGGQNVTLLSELGQGAFSTVFLIDVNGKNKAIKIMSEPAEEGIKSLIEIDIMSKLFHPNLVNTEGILVGIEKEEINIPSVPSLPLLKPVSGISGIVPPLEIPGIIPKQKVTVGIIMPLAQTDLQKMLRSSTLTLQQRLKLLYDITNGLKYLHDANYLHLDLKPLNILLYDSPNLDNNNNNNNNNLIAKITDFSLSLILEESSKYYPTELVTITHRAPEIMNGDKIYTKASDIWSLGIIFLEVLSDGKKMFDDFSKTTVKKTVNKLFNEKKINDTLNIYLSNLPIDIKLEAIDIIRRMLTWTPKNRPLTDDILKSSLFINTFQPVMNNITYGLDSKNITYGRDSKNHIIKYNKPHQPRKSNLQTEESFLIYYYGFDLMIKTAMKLFVKTETVFLAADIYQRSLAFSNQLTGDNKKDWSNVALMATTSLYMAIKMIEGYHPDVIALTNLTSNVFPFTDIIRVEASLTQMFEGIIYQRNFFTDTYRIDKLIYSFDNIIRNCHLYYRMDLNLWVKKDQDKIPFNKHTLFSDFVKTTEYYNIIRNKEQKVYISEFYQKDLAIAKQYK